MSDYLRGGKKIYTYMGYRIYWSEKQELWVIYDKDDYMGAEWSINRARILIRRWEKSGKISSAYAELGMSTASRSADRSARKPIRK